MSGPFFVSGAIIFPSLMPRKIYVVESITPGAIEIADIGYVKFNLGYV
jgi:hypothetical protein